MKRLSVISSLAAYLLAATAIHALHDHSAGGHCSHNELSCDFGASHAEHCKGSQSVDASDESAGHHRQSSPNNCEDSCFACSFLAVKSIVAAVVLPVERFETVCQLEPVQRAFVSSARIECSLCRGPPSAC